MTQFTGSKRVAELLARDLHGRVKLEDAGFDWKILGPDVDQVGGGGEGLGEGEGQEKGGGKGEGKGGVEGEGEGVGMKEKGRSGRF